MSKLATKKKNYIKIIHFKFREQEMPSTRRDDYLKNNGEYGRDTLEVIWLTSSIKMNRKKIED